MVKRGRKVTLVESGNQLGIGLPVTSKEKLFNWLDIKGVTMLTGVKYEEITDEGLTIITGEGKRQTIKADTIVPAMPSRPNTELFETLSGKVPEIHLIGDCREPALTLEAIADGSRIGRAI